MAGPNRPRARARAQRAAVRAPPRAVASWWDEMREERRGGAAGGRVHAGRAQWRTARRALTARGPSQFGPAEDVCVAEAPPRRSCQ